MIDLRSDTVTLPSPAMRRAMAEAELGDDVMHEDPTVDLVAVRDAFRDPGDPHEPVTALVSIENTHSLSMGQPLGPEYTAAVARVAASRGVPLFIDGARLFDAAVSLGVPARALIPDGASATFCLSKSLGCPVGSVVVGPA